MLILGVYIKGNDFVGILNGKIKVFLEIFMINWFVFLVSNRDKVKFIFFGYFLGNFFKVFGFSRIFRRG